MTATLSAFSASSLYWFGRYTQRIEGMLFALMEAHDRVIDQQFPAGQDLMKKLGVTISYEDASEFLEEAVYGDHTANLLTCADNARENAIIIRNHIPDGAFVAVNKIWRLFKEQEQSLHAIDIIFLENEILSLLRTVWGSLRQQTLRGIGDELIEFGRIIERIDLYIRTQDDLNYVLIQQEALNRIGHRVSRSYKPAAVGHSDKTRLLQSFNSLIDTIITDAP